MLKHLLTSLILLLGMSSVKAESLTIQPFVKGSFADIKNQNQNKPFILVFWSESCSYCMKELSMFGKLHQQYPDMKLITVATDSFLEDSIVKKVLSSSRLDLKQTWVFAEQFPERIYADVDKRWRGELPLTYFFDRNHQEIRHLGIVNRDELVKWLNAEVK